MFYWIACNIYAFLPCTDALHHNEWECTIFFHIIRPRTDVQTWQTHVTAPTAVVYKAICKELPQDFLSFPWSGTPSCPSWNDRLTKFSRSVKELCNTALCYASHSETRSSGVLSKNATFHIVFRKSYLYCPWDLPSKISKHNRDMKNGWCLLKLQHQMSLSWCLSQVQQPIQNPPKHTVQVKLPDAEMWTVDSEGSGICKFCVHTQLHKLAVFTVPVPVIKLQGSNSQC